MKPWLIAVVCSLAFIIVLVPVNHEIDYEQLPFDDVSTQGRAIGDYATGGYHLVSGEWWEKPIGYRPTVDDLHKNGRNFPPNFLHESWMDYLYWDIELEP